MLIMGILFFLSLVFSSLPRSLNIPHQQQTVNYVEKDKSSQGQDPYAYAPSNALNN